MSRLIKLDEFTDNLYSVKAYQRGDDNRDDIERMKNFLRIAIPAELTEKQRLCICGYFLENRKMKDLAAELDISPSAVSRIIKRAINTLQKRTVYY